MAASSHTPSSWTSTPRARGHGLSPLGPLRLDLPFQQLRVWPVWRRQLGQGPLTLVELSWLTPSSTPATRRLRTGERVLPGYLLYPISSHALSNYLSFWLQFHAFLWNFSDCCNGNSQLLTLMSHLHSQILFLLGLEIKFCLQIQTATPGSIEMYLTVCVRLLSAV